MTKAEIVQMIGKNGYVPSGSRRRAVVFTKPVTREEGSEHPRFIITYGKKESIEA